MEEYEPLIVEILAENKPELSEATPNERSVSQLESTIRPSSSPSVEPHHRRYDSGEAYFPFPKITFLIDKPRGLLCQICQMSKCKIRSDSHRIRDSTFSILPCGHIAGSRCMASWLNEKNTCPFCRFGMNYPGCGHKIPPRVMTEQNVHLLPRTLPDKGCIPDLCTECYKESLMVQAKSNFKDAAHDFEEARRQFHETGGVNEEQTMIEKREAFENIMRDEVYLPHLSSWMISW